MVTSNSFHKISTRRSSLLNATNQFEEREREFLKKRMVTVYFEPRLFLQCLENIISKYYGKDRSAKNGNEALKRGFFHIVNS